MLYSLEAARANVRNREGKRVFYLGKGDQLTSDARDFLTRERIEILPADQAKPQRWKLLGGGYMEEKPEHMTHLNGDTLVPKTHPRIAFRGAMDTLEAEIMLCQLRIPCLQTPLEEILQLARDILRCEVLDEPLKERKLCGLTEDEQRRRSHCPQDFYGQPHFMPQVTDGETVLQLNKVRTAVRAAELKAAAALPYREDILRAMNRMSSMVYLLMIAEKAKR
ncbi:MAG: ATP-binding protein [Oscillospiraceae bacterium]|nr:ATP-binding protein [Oscillospiraceae bacterium]